MLVISFLSPELSLLWSAETLTLSFLRATPFKSCFLPLEYCRHLKEVTGIETVISRVTLWTKEWSCQSDEYSLYFAGSTTLFNALLMKCLEREVMALCRYTARRNTPPRFVALVPQEEEVDEQKVQVAPPGMGKGAAFPCTIGCSQYNSLLYRVKIFLVLLPLKLRRVLSNIPFLQFCHCKDLMLNLFLKPQLHQRLLRYNTATVFSLPPTSLADLSNWPKN